MKHLKASWQRHQMLLQRKKRRDEQQAVARRAKHEHDRNARRAAHIKVLDQVQEEQRRRSYHRL